MGEDVFVGPILIFHSAVRGKIASCHCYTFKLPDKIQLLTDFTRGWHDALASGMTCGWNPPGTPSKLYVKTSVRLKH